MIMIPHVTTMRAACHGLYAAIVATSDLLLLLPVAAVVVVNIYRGRDFSIIAVENDALESKKRPRDLLVST